ncbi:MAG: Linear gramicidin synthase subunit D [Candidatus Accumulibacter appositus]|uniref:Linear gramicidin synthase subunit D n=1 Tax=Candidatus Accumulibacter appositus TaxID=1454003 RepID=A0A011PN55_9PROT|nr:amino acid adenylation domain-containing protein [Accumulibacter sp.]EXI78300.1 MAG: Linear gramicidin synthase subunit D [Candidatus Accumulibacter appositus]HRF04081.1 amino acid adenylation domain-containing protein [Accumulibacter sp.]
MTNDSIQAIYPLTALQEGLLLHTLDGKRPGAYFEQYCCDFHGELALANLQWAWQSACDRHDVLRTLFTWDGRDRPLQIVRKRVDLPWIEHDWLRMAPEEQERRWQDLLRADRARGFVLDEAPLLRVSVISLNSGRMRLLVSFHHVLMDAWSLQIVLDEVAHLYRARCSGVPSGLPAPRPFADFVAWTAAQDREQGMAFWRSALSGYVPLPAPDFGRPVTAAQPEDTNTLRLDLDHTLVARLEAFARRQQVTLACCFAGAWALLMARYSGAADLAFGFTSAGRPTELEGGERMVGLLMNTPPLRVWVDPAQTPAEWLRGLQLAQLRMRDFEHTPLVDIQRACDGCAGQALFETVLVFENAPVAKANTNTGLAGQLSVRDQAYFAYSNYPLAMIVIPGPQLSLRLVFDPGRYAEPAMRRVLRHMERALSALCDTALSRLGEIDILSPDEQAIVAAPERDPGRGRPVPEALHAHGSALADALAVVDGALRLSYADLARRTDALAGQLQAHGIGPGHCVPICASRSGMAVVAMLAVLKSGAAHAVIDAGLPLPRIKDMLADLAAGARAGGRLIADRILVDAAGAQLLDGQANALIAIDSASRKAAACTLSRPLDGEDLAYVIYTSGSTGAPKGVALSHRNLTASLLARAAFYPSAPQRFLLLSAIGTDSTIAGVYWPLYFGGTLVVAPERIEQNPLALAKLIDSQRISHLLCLPSLWEALLEQVPADTLSSLRCVVVAGEACSPAVVAAHFSRLPTVGLYNEYGPAEAAVWATATALEAATAVRAAGVSIGCAIATARVHVLDADGRPCPLGIAGELCIGGAGVARAYWNPDTPDQTRFTTLPWQPDARMYRSGDRARQRPDGAFEFLGRIDNQVKIRGYRVEPEEIEGILVRHPDVREAVVVAVNQSVGDGQAALHAALSALPEGEAERLLAQVEAMTQPPASQASGARSLS